MSKTAPAPTKAVKPALMQIKEQVVDQVTNRVQIFIKSGQLHLPAGYSASNAMHAAWLILQDTKDKNNRSVLETCTRASIANSLFRMVVRGLDPAKKQGYFIAYGDQLSFQESYFGNIAMAQRMAGVAEVLTMVVCGGDEFELAIERGRFVVEYHKPRMDANEQTPITPAYCIVEFTDDRPPVTEVMRWDQIQTSWKKSRGNPNREGGPHKEQPDQMAMRTVINRALKRYINASTDAHLAELLREIQASDEIAAAQADLDEEYNTQANREPLQLEEHDEQTIDAETGEILDEQEPQAVPAASRADEQQLMDPGY